MSAKKCVGCEQTIDDLDKFCPHCGNSIKETVASPNSKTETEGKTIKSSGNYSGKMVKGKKSRAWKIMRNIIIISVVIGIIAFIIWYNTDPDAKEKLGNILFGAVVMLLFGSYIWWRGKKGKIKASKNREPNYDWDDQDDDLDD